MSELKLQYYCSNCKTVLREMQQDFIPHHITEPCPECGSLLSQSLQKRPILNKITPPVLFEQASAIPKLTFDISKLDATIQFLRINQIVGIIGYSSQKLIERLCVRAQLPKRYGGLDSTVILIDASNSSDPYLGINFARQYGMSVENVLSKIITSRAFTVHQLAHLIINELPNILKQYNSKFVVISDLFGMFNDPYLDTKEAEIILQEIINTISKLRNCLVVISISKQTKFDYIITSKCDRVITSSKKYHRVSFEINNKEPVLVKQSELEIIAR